MKNYLTFLNAIILTMFLFSCDSYVDSASKKQLLLYMKQSSDQTKSTVYRLEKYIQLKEKMAYTPVEYHKPVEEYVKKNKEFFQELLFDLKPKQLLYNDTEEYIFKLSSYGYLPNEEIIITKEDVFAYSEIPKQKKSLEEIKAELEYNENSKVNLPIDKTIMITDTIKISKDDWLILNFEGKNLYIHPNALIGTSRLKDKNKAKAIWLMVQYFKRYSRNNDSYRMITFLMYEFNLNINRKLLAGFNYIHYAVQRGDDPKFFVEYLLDLNADINAKDTSGNTPLDYALKSSAIINFNHPEDYNEEQKQSWPAKREKVKNIFINYLKSKGAVSGGN